MGVTALLIASAPSLSAAAVRLVNETPQEVVAVAPNVSLVDFGRVAFGNLEIRAPAGASGEVIVRFGEDLVEGRINRVPPGSVRFVEVRTPLVADGWATVAPPPDPRNTLQPQAVLTPPSWGVVLPFRWVEIEGWPGPVKADCVRRRAAFSASWDDAAATFHSSDPMLDRIWELCHYSIKATSFAGVFVDGDRERICYEADAYLNELGYLAGDPDPQMGRDTFDRLVKLPTWPTEWGPHMVFLAHEDWMHTADCAWLESRYALLWSKLLLERVGPDGLVLSTPAQVMRGDIVDWPAGERDGYVFCPVNTVVNAFHLRALSQMRDLSRALGREEDVRALDSRISASSAAFQRLLFDESRGLYRDGVGTDHASLHANLFPLAFDLTPQAHRQATAKWLSERGMVCSVYPAQYLLEALFENGASREALALMAAPGDRSWRHMVESGTTITWEAWDQRYKPNQDWTHAWGAAPANLLPNYVLGVRPCAPGFSQVDIRPHVGALDFCEGQVPTPHGPVHVRWVNASDFRLELTLPPGVTAHVFVPDAGTGQAVYLDEHRIPAVQDSGFLAVTAELKGRHRIERK